VGKERVFEPIKKKKLRASGFIHIGEIIPSVVRDIEGRIKESHKDKKAGRGSKAEEAS